MSDYNGWSNWHSWNASLWLNGVEGAYKWTLELLQDAVPFEDTDDYSLWHSEIEQICRESFAETFGDGWDGIDMDKVNWVEVGEGFLS
jgi:hypothetical protein